MFAQSLPEDRKWELLKIVRLLQVFEAPLLWGGKTEDELTGTADLSDIKFATTDAMKQAWENAARIYGDRDDLYEEDTTGLIKKLLDEIRKLRITRQNDKDERLKIAMAILRGPIFGHGTDEEITDPSQIMWKLPKFRTLSNGFITRPARASTLLSEHSRAVLFEAMRFSVNSGGLSDSKKSLLQFASSVYDIDSESFEELLAQAIALNKELTRSINLVFE